MPFETSLRPPLFLNWRLTLSLKLLWKTNPSTKKLWISNPFNFSLFLISLMGSVYLFLVIKQIGTPLSSTQTSGKITLTFLFILSIALNSTKKLVKNSSLSPLVNSDYLSSIKYFWTTFILLKTIFWHKLHLQPSLSIWCSILLLMRLVGEREGERFSRFCLSIVSVNFMRDIITNLY